MSANLQPQPNTATGDAPSVPDERDAIIERLERAVADERQNSATLRKTVEELRFKADVLEKGYAKQLADARLRTETVERELADKQARLDALDGGHEDTLRLLTETRAQLAHVTADRDGLRKALASNGLRADFVAPERFESHAQEGQTINELMTNASWARKAQASDDANAHLHAQVSVDPSPVEEMIAPELVFTGGRDDED